MNLTVELVFIKLTATYFCGFFPIFPSHCLSVFPHIYLGGQYIPSAQTCKNNTLDFAANTNSLHLHGPLLLEFATWKLIYYGDFPLRHGRGGFSIYGGWEGAIGSLINYTVSKKALGISARSCLPNQRNQGQVDG
jgi:hypothetical protein